MVEHYTITLPSWGRGFHIITEQVLEGLPELPQNGILHLFIQHTSAGLTINENADSTVLQDFESFFNDIVKENMPYVKHDMEGPDDMPAHIKATMVGSSVSIPIVSGRLALGAWQGIYLCEFRNAHHRRRIVASLMT